MSSEDAANDNDSCVANERELKMAEDSWGQPAGGTNSRQYHLSI